MSVPIKIDGKAKPWRVYYTAGGKRIATHFASQAEVWNWQRDNSS